MTGKARPVWSSDGTDPDFAKRLHQTMQIWQDAVASNDGDGKARARTWLVALTLVFDGDELAFAVALDRAHFTARVTAALLPFRGAGVTAANLRAAKSALVLATAQD